MSDDNSYGRILRSSAIIGGAHGLNYLVALLRVKIIAVLLGPAGVGLIGLYQSATSLIGTVSGLGIASSAVREVAKAQSEGDAVEAARMMAVIRRMAWLTGLLGWALTAALAYPVSFWAFGNHEHVVPIALLGSTLLLGSLSGARNAILQGVRRIGDIARVNVYGMLINSAMAIGIYAWLREEGIVSVIIVSAAVSLAVSHWFARKVELSAPSIGWRDSFASARSLFQLGAAFMWSGLLTAGLDMATRSFITRGFGIDAAGQYQAAWALSGMFAGFILSAMGTDFYPRLTNVIDDHPQAARVINEQTEVGVLLALPGLVATMTFAPLLVHALYSAQFLQAADLLPWFVLGVFGRVISWPLGYIMLAAGAGRWFAISETVFIGLQGCLVWFLVPTLGPLGAAIAFALNYCVCTVAMLWVARRLIGFRWSAGVVRLLGTSALMMAATALITFLLPPLAAYAAGGIVTVIAAGVTVRGLSSRLGHDHRFIRLVARLPYGEFLLRA